MRNVMQKAWEIAREGVRKFGGNVKEYFAQALRMAWAIVKKKKKMFKINKESMESVVGKVASQLSYNVEVEPNYVGRNLTGVSIVRFGRVRGTVSINAGKFDIVEGVEKIAEAATAEELLEGLRRLTTYNITERGYLDIDYETYSSMNQEEKDHMKKTFMWNRENKKWEVKEDGDHDYILNISNLVRERAKTHYEIIMERLVHPTLRDRVTKELA